MNVRRTIGALVATAGIAGAMAAGTLVPSGAAAEVVPMKANLATIAAKYVGGLAKDACRDANISSPHYQCKVFASCISKLGNKVRLAGDYYNTYKDHGYHKVSRTNARPGDIIQLYKKSNTSGYYQGMHTAIVASKFDGNTATVIDSNFGGDSYGREKVRKHRFNPFEREGRYGLTVAIWRFGG